MDERIDDYFGQRLSGDAKEKFEADLKSDPELANDVAFYLAAKKTASLEARDTRLQERHLEWQKLRNPAQKYVSIRTWYSVAAALALVTFGLTWYWLMPANRDLNQMAGGYLMENFTTLSVQMGDTGDSLQLAISNYNNGQYATSIKICQNLLEKDPDNAEAKKIAGIVYLKLLDYDKAIEYFHHLAEQKNLYSNPGKFYEAIALIRRDLPLDKKKAEDLLREVIAGNLEGKDEAVKWMK